MEYLGPLIGLIAAIVALRGTTWDENAKGWRRLTTSGRITVAIALAGFVFSIVSLYHGRGAAVIAEARANETLGNSRAANDTIAILRRNLAATLEQVGQANAKADSLAVRLSVYKDVLEVLRAQSERQIQQVMTEFAELGRVPWEAPNTIYGGSVIKLYGFDCDVTLRYGDRTEKLERRFGPNPETMVVGSSGVPMRWTLSSDSRCAGKVQVTSSPRGRSVDWSSLEERLGSRIGDVKQAGGAIATKYRKKS